MIVKNKTSVQALAHIPVLLMCDFVDIDHNLEKLVDSVTFLPICNIPLIQHSLDNLIIQGFVHIFFCIKYKELITKIEAIVNNLYPNIILARFVIGNNYGDIMRSIDDFDYGFDVFLIFPINFITNINVNIMVHDFILSRKKDQKIVMSILMFEKVGFSNGIDVYGFCRNELGMDELFYYEKTVVNSRINKRMFDVVGKYKSLLFRTQCISPRFCVVSKEVFALFSENYDYASMDSLVESSLANNLYNYRFMLNIPDSRLLNDDLEYINETMTNLSIENETICKIVQNIDDFYQINFFFKDYQSLRIGLLEMNLFHNDYICEYQTFESNLLAVRNSGAKKLSRFISVNIKDSIVGSDVDNVEEFEIVNSIINHGTTVDTNMIDSISFNNFVMQKRRDKYFVYHKNNLKYDYIPENYSDVITEESEETNSSNANTFHSEILAYLTDVTEDVLSRNIEISMVRKQVNLIAIIWKANSRDLIDVFTIFISEFINQNDLDQSTINVSMFFPIIEGSLNEPQVQENFIRTIYDGLKIKSKRLRKEAFIRIGYAMMDDGLIEKDVLNRTNIVKGNFFK